MWSWSEVNDFFTGWYIYKKNGYMIINYKVKNFLSI